MTSRDELWAEAMEKLERMNAEIKELEAAEALHRTEAQEGGKSDERNGGMDQKPEAG